MTPYVLSRIGPRHRDPRKTESRMVAIHSPRRRGMALVFARLFVCRTSVRTLGNCMENKDHPATVRNINRMEEQRQANNRAMSRGEIEALPSRSLNSELVEADCTPTGQKAPEPSTAGARLSGSGPSQARGDSCRTTLLRPPLRTSISHAKILWAKPPEESPAFGEARPLNISSRLSLTDERAGSQHERCLRRAATKRAKAAGARHVPSLPGSMKTSGRRSRPLRPLPVFPRRRFGVSMCQVFG
jgi:hypothetical protein